MILLSIQDSRHLFYSSNKQNAVSLVELILVLVAIAFITLSGIQFIGSRIEQNKVRKAADQIEGWLLAAQAYFREAISTQPANAVLSASWPIKLSDMYPYISSTAVAAKLSDISTRDPWGNIYQPQPASHFYTEPSDWGHTPVTSVNDLNFFTLQVKVANRDRALAIAAQLPNARIVSANDGIYLNAFIPPPVLVKTAVGHQLVMNLGVVQTKNNHIIDRPDNLYNYTIDGYDWEYPNWSSSGSSSPLTFARALIATEHGYNPHQPGSATNQPLTQEQIQGRGAVFIRKPVCPSGTDPYIQASAAGFGLVGGYSFSPNQLNTYYTNSCTGGCSVSKIASSAANISTVSPVPSSLAGNVGGSPGGPPEGMSPFYFIDMTADDNYKYGNNSVPAISQAIGSIIGVHVKAAEQPMKDVNGNNTTLDGWYLWVDISANAMMFLNYPTTDLPQVMQDCAMNINTFTGDKNKAITNTNDQYPYGYDSTALDATPPYPSGYEFVPSNVYPSSTYPSNPVPYMQPTDLIASAVPLYRPSPCHFHDGYIAYLVSCVPNTPISGTSPSQTIAEKNGLSSAMADLES